MINEKTEVSFEVVEKMALTARSKLTADFSIATSGYAGPTGGDKINPVGTVFIAISSKNKTTSDRFVFAGARESIVNQSVFKGVELLIREIKKYR
jgi:PncC family amidohydrolase